MYGWSTNQLKEEMNYIKDVSYWGYFVFLAFEADRRVGSEAWMGMLSRHFESLIWEGNVSPFLCDDAKGISIISSTSFSWVAVPYRQRGHETQGPYWVWCGGSWVVLH